jgi:tetratricopeptide (TPR) repeat protein
VERRPQWPVAVRLEPLPEQDVGNLIPDTVSDDLRGKITRAAGGNPLFVTEMVSMARETEGEVAVPPTLQALLAARLDQLETNERSVLERGAVEGEIFHRGAIQALSDDGQVTPRLASLVRKELIRPDRPLLRGEDAFRFRHLLIRDAAYDALPKTIRSDLHRRYARWLGEHGAELVELDEILGHHLEQAARYMTELGQADPELAEAAGKRLASAGRRAFWRGDERAAALLLERALELTRPMRLDVVLELDFAQALNYPEPGKAADVANTVAERARASGDESGEKLARAAAAYHRTWFEPDPDIDELETLALQALPLLEHTGDHAGLVHVWRSLGYGVANFRGRWGDWVQAAEQALLHARLAGQQPASLLGLELALASSPRPADDALAALDGLLPDNPHPFALLTRAWLLAMLGRFEEALPIEQEASDRLQELLGDDDRSGWMRGRIEELKGDLDAAARHTRETCVRIEAQGLRFFLSSIAPMLGRQLCALGEYEEAERWVERARELDVRGNVLGEAEIRQVEALMLAHRGDHARAEQTAREAVEIIERTDGLNYQGDAFCDLAEVLATAGRTDEAVAALEQALERYARKKNLAMVAQVRPKLDALLLQLEQ